MALCNDFDKTTALRQQYPSICHIAHKPFDKLDLRACGADKDKAGDELNFPVTFATSDTTSELFYSLHHNEGDYTNLSIKSPFGKDIFIFSQIKPQSFKHIVSSENYTPVLDRDGQFTGEWVSAQEITPLKTERATRADNLKQAFQAGHLVYLIPEDKYDAFKQTVKQMQEALKNASVEDINNTAAELVPELEAKGILVKLNDRLQGHFTDSDVYNLLQELTPTAAAAEPLKCAIFDNHTFDSDIYKKNYPSATIYQSDASQESILPAHPLQEAPMNVQQDTSIISCDHGGLVAGCFLAQWGNKPVDLHVVNTQPYATHQERRQTEKHYKAAKRRVLADPQAQWQGASGYNAPKPFQKLQTLQNYIATEKVDCISLSYFFVNPTSGDQKNTAIRQEALMRDEVENNFGFFAIKKEEALSKDLKARLNAVLAPLAQKHNADLLTDGEKKDYQNMAAVYDNLTLWRDAYTQACTKSSKETGNYKVEQILKTKECQSALAQVQASFEAMAKTDDPVLKNYAEDSLLSIKNLQPIHINGQERIRCIYNTTDYRNKRIAAEDNAIPAFQNTLKMSDNKNIGVFSVDALYNHYGFFVGGLDYGSEQFSASKPLARRVDQRLDLLTPQNTVLFNAHLDKLPDIPNSYAGKDGVMAKNDGTGVSGLIPQLSATFMLARSVDKDIRPQEFFDILRCSGSVSLIKDENGIVYGGVISDIDKLKQNAAAWKATRLDTTAYAQMSLTQKAYRNKAFYRYMSDLKQTPVSISYFKETGVVKEETTYAEYLSRSDAWVKNTPEQEASKQESPKSTATDTAKKPNIILAAFNNLSARND